MGEQVNSLQTSFWFMVILQTVGSVDMPGKGPRKMPSPRNYAALIVAWGTLQLVADMGMERAAKAIAWVLVLGGLVLGPFGTIVSNALNSVSSTVGSSSAPPTTSTQSTG